MWYKLFVEGRLDAGDANRVKDGIAEKFGFNRIVINRKEKYVLLSMDDDYMVARVVDYIGECGLEVNSYKGIE